MGAAASENAVMDTSLKTVRPGTTIKLVGEVSYKTDRFGINLFTGAGDIALHVGPRFDQKCVVFNSRRDNNWEQEERVFRLPGRNLEVLIFVREDAYEVYVDGHHWAEFKHRMHYCSITRIEVYGNFTIRLFEQYDGEPSEKSAPKATYWGQ